MRVTDRRHLIPEKLFGKGELPLGSREVALARQHRAGRDRGVGAEPLRLLLIRPRIARACSAWLRAIVSRPRSAAIRASIAWAKAYPGGRLHSVWVLDCSPRRRPGLVEFSREVKGARERGVGRDEDLIGATVDKLGRAATVSDRFADPAVDTGGADHPQHRIGIHPEPLRMLMSRSAREPDKPPSFERQVTEHGRRRRCRAGQFRMRHEAIVRQCACPPEQRAGAPVPEQPQVIMLRISATTS